MFPFVRRRGTFSSLLPNHSKGVRIKELRLTIKKLVDLNYKISIVVRRRTNRLFEFSLIFYNTYRFIFWLNLIKYQYF